MIGCNCRARLSDSCGMKSGVSVRDQRIDFIKCMLMWGVVYGHTINALLLGIAHVPIWLHTFVRTFDMPFFMILSGFFLRKSLVKRSAIDVFVNRLSMILVPTVVWTLLLCRIDIFNRYYFLWAVLCSGIVCIVGHATVQLLHSGIRWGLECLLYIGVIVLLHIFKVPWNMFYLFPFFVVGYYLRDVNVDKKLGWIMSVVFIVGLCFWESSYTPWSIGAHAWRENPNAFLIYGYRFFLGIAGVYTMGIVFDSIRRLCGEESFFVQVVVGWGRETLALYILQALCVEIGLRLLLEHFMRLSAVSTSGSIVNLIGYFIAPILSFLSLWILFNVVKGLKSRKVLKYAFGFKVMQPSDNIMH